MNDRTDDQTDSAASIREDLTDLILEVGRVAYARGDVHGARLMRGWAYAVAHGLLTEDDVQDDELAERRYRNRGELERLEGELEALGVFEKMAADLEAAYDGPCPSWCASGHDRDDAASVFHWGEAKELTTADGHDVHVRPFAVEHRLNAGVGEYVEGPGVYLDDTVLTADEAQQVADALQQAASDLRRDMLHALTTDANE